MLIDKACFERGCACHDPRVDTESVEVEAATECIKYYDAGWNAAIEVAADKLQHEFKSAFGADTLASIAAYMRGMKR
mgnify:CR=1 FL=1